MRGWWGWVGDGVGGRDSRQMWILATCPPFRPPVPDRAVAGLKCYMLLAPELALGSCKPQRHMLCLLCLLLCLRRGDVVDLDDHKLPYIQDVEAPCPDLLSAVDAVKPTVLIGLTAGADPPFAFTRQASKQAHARSCGLH